MGEVLNFLVVGRPGAFTGEEVLKRLFGVISMVFTFRFSALYGPLSERNDAIV